MNHQKESCAPHTEVIREQLSLNHEDGSDLLDDNLESHLFASADALQDICSRTGIQAMHCCLIVNVKFVDQ